MNHLNPFVSLLLVVCGIALGFAFGVFWATRHPREAKSALAKAHVGNPPTEPATTVVVPVDNQGNIVGQAAIEPSQTVTKKPPTW